MRDIIWHMLGWSIIIFVVCVAIGFIIGVLMNDSEAIGGCVQLGSGAGLIIALLYIANVLIHL